MQMLIDKYFTTDLAALAEAEQWLEDDWQEARKDAGKEITNEDEIDEEKIEDLAETWEGVMFAKMAAKIVELEKAVAGLKHQLDDKNDCC